MKKLPIISILILVCLTLANSFGEKMPADSSGLSVHEGQLMLKGEPYRGVGANYFSLFSRTLKDPSDKSYDEGLEKLADAGIPFVRFMACGFWPVDWELYLRDKDEYFKRMDRVVRAAERHNIGLIPSLFWYMPAVPDIVGEPIDQLGNPKSKTIAFIEQYTKEVVLRYRDSSAIWAWEFGNEYNLNVDLPNASAHRPKVVPQLKTALKRTARDELSSQAMRTALAHFAGTIRKYDKHRLLTTGHSIPRTSAYHNTKEKSWKKDSREQFAEVLRRDNPDPFGVISVHIYRNSGQANTKSIPALVAAVSDISSNAHKPLFIGEFGASLTLDKDKEKSLFVEFLAAIETNKVPLSAFWVFDYSAQNKDWNVTFENDRKYMLKLITEANQRMKADPSGPENDQHKDAAEKSLQP